LTPFLVTRNAMETNSGAQKSNGHCFWPPGMSWKPFLVTRNPIVTSCGHHTSKINENHAKASKIIRVEMTRRRVGMRFLAARNPIDTIRQKCHGNHFW